MHKKIFRISTPVLVLILCLYTLSNPTSVIFYTQEAVKMCAISVMPSLFIFMVLSKILSFLCAGVFWGGKTSHLFFRFFNLPPSLLTACFMGFFCGAPSSTFTICSLYDDGFCTKAQAERACILTGGVSFSFMNGFVAVMLASRLSAVLVVISNFLSLIFIYSVFFRGEKSSFTPKAKKSVVRKSAPQITADSICSAVTSCTALCGYVIFFYTLSHTAIDCLSPLISYLFCDTSHANTAKAVISSFFEITSAILRLAPLSKYPAVVLCSFQSSFMGLSMLLQVSGVMSKSGLSSKGFIISRLLCSLVSPVVTTFILLALPEKLSVSCFLSSNIRGGVSFGDVIYLAFSAASVFAGAYILSRVDKKHKK